RGQTYQLMERYEEALKDFTLAIELNSKFGWAIALRGRTYKLMERYEEALKDFALAIELNPKSDWMIAMRGGTYRLMKRYEEALRDFTLAIELNFKHDWAMAGRGEMYLLFGRYREALVDFNHAVESNAKDDWWLYDRAITYQALGQVEQAKADLAQALYLAQADYEKDPEDWVNTFNLALYHLAAKEDEQAKSFYRDALRRDAPAPRIRLALQDLENFLTIFPDHRLARAAHQVLQKELQKRLALT
ncbi:MAG: tetratricopeptide repeat protein, partial [Phormidesmis sp. CAN_BIN36]|nr:tetratricopeptide repeat protein [Phormidesmis sp. CAN_BIN36]